MQADAGRTTGECAQRPGAAQSPRVQLAPVNLVAGYAFLVVAIGALLTQGSSPLVLLLVPFALGSHAVHLVIAHRAVGMAAQRMTSIAMLGYMAWATYVYVGAFHGHRDPQSGIALLLITPYSLPVLAPVWLWIVVSLLWENRRRRCAGLLARAT